MKKTQRQYYNRPNSKKSDDKLKRYHNRAEMLPPEDVPSKPHDINPFLTESKVNRCCSACPDQKNVSLMVENLTADKDNYQSILLNQYGFEPVLPETLSQLQELRKVLCTRSAPKIDNSSQYSRDNCVVANEVDKDTESEKTEWKDVDNIDDVDAATNKSDWQDVDNNDEVDVVNDKTEWKDVDNNDDVDAASDKTDWQDVDNNDDVDVLNDRTEWKDIDNVDGVDKYVDFVKSSAETFKQSVLPQAVHISEVPYVKIIAEKYSKYKKNNIELRKLEEKIVCIEYDVFANMQMNTSPIQKMRAFFSIKPTIENSKADASTNVRVPSVLQHNFNIDDEDLKRLNRKEIEIIDGQILENKPYLDDLRKVVKKRQIIKENKKQNNVNLLTLYEIATKDYTPAAATSQAVLSKGQLNEVKSLILKQSDSTTTGVVRRSFKSAKAHLEESVFPTTNSVCTDLLLKNII